MVKWELAGETEVLGESPPQCHFVHEKSRITWTGIEAGAWRLNYGTDSLLINKNIIDYHVI
jgi:hypothetical protein